MSKVTRLLGFVWEFVVGDDWRIAVAVAAGIALTALLADGGIRAWWLLPVVVAGVLSTSIWTVAQSRG